MARQSKQAPKGKARGLTRAAGDTARSRLVLLAAVLLSALILVAWFPANSLVHQRSSLASASQQLTELHHQDAALSQEKKNLSQTAEIARIARSQYQLVSPGQQAYEVLPPAGQATAGTPYAGDPGSTTPVAPSAESVLPAGGVTSTTTPAIASKALSGTTHQSSASVGFLQRMLRAVQFWR